MLQAPLSVRTARARSSSCSEGGQPVDTKQVDCLILSGGQGTRLFPLTLARCKPGVPFGGYYRLIDIALSHAVHAHFRKIFVLTQFLASSLHQHIYKTYLPQATGAETIEILTAEQRPNSQCWYQGTADAVRQNIPYLQDSPADYFLILSGDQIYSLDLLAMLRFAKSKDADLVIASLPVDGKQAPRLGLLQIDHRQRIQDFYEKPQSADILERFVCPPSILENYKTGSELPFYLGSMGIYLFKKEVLLQLLKSDPREDFGKHLIPTQISKGNSYTYLHDGYWEDIGTIEAYYQANIALTRREPAFSLHMDHAPLYTMHLGLPAASILGCRINHSFLCDGSVLEGEEISNSIIGPRTVLHRGSCIHDSYIMGNCAYTNQQGEPSQIGRNCVIQNAILDLNVQLGDDVQLTNRAKVKEFDGNGIYIRDGITVVTAGTRLPDGFTL